MIEIEIGTELCGVRIDELAARSPTSTVYRGTNLATGAMMALKVLSESDPATHRRLQREAELLSGIDHPGIVRFHGFSDLAGRAVLVTEWIDGASLLEGLRSGKTYSSGQAIALLRALAGPLDFLHSQTIVHRDISPANIIMNSNGTPVLVDLGIGHAVGQATMTSHDLVAGTPKYLAPEVIRGEAASPQSDQYALAVVLHELIAGRSPFPASTELATALHHHMHTTPEPLNEFDPAVPDALASAVARAMSKEPAKRFATITDFALATSGSAASRGSSQSGHRRGRLMLAGLVGITALVVAGVALATARGDTDGPEAAGLASTATAPRTASPGTTPSGAGSEGALPPAEHSSWPAGTADLLACNLLTGTVFENGSVPLDYYGNPPGRERVVDSGGYADSWALQVGLADNYSQFGEIIPVTTGESYVFAGWFRHVGQVADAQFGITLLDASYNGLDLSVTAPIPNGDGSFGQTRFDAMPVEAAFAVPFLFKDSSPGVVLADELVFGPTQRCAPDLAPLTNS